jgi:hypothetical protein
LRAQSFTEKASRRAKRRPKPGPTGDFPHGKLSPDDEGGIGVALSHFTAPDGARMVRIDYGKAVAWLALPHAHAVAFALLILKHTGIEVEIGDAEDLGRRGQGDSQVEP